jgi:hypothetical protein
LHDAEKEISQICGLFRDCWQALVEGDWLTLETLLPDRIRRQRWCDAAAKVPPRPGPGDRNPHRHRPTPGPPAL